MTARPPPIRIVTRLLAEMQTAIVSGGLHLTNGDLDRFAMLSLIVGQASKSGSATCMSIKSLADSLSKPYETVRRQVTKLVESGLCERRPEGICLSQAAATTATLSSVVQHTHDAFVRFVEDLRNQAVDIPPAASRSDYHPSVGVAAAADILLSVLDGNQSTHRNWIQLVVFSAALKINAADFVRDRDRSGTLADERSVAPVEWLCPARASAVAHLLGLPETSIRRQLMQMTDDAILLKTSAGYLVCDEWLNAPPQVAVSRASYANVRRILARAAAAGFPIDDPATAYIGSPPAGG